MVKSEVINDSDYNENSKFFSQKWTMTKIYIVSFLSRILFVYYGRIHDYLFEVQFTDVDYKVYTDAAELVIQSKSPYDRATYRYSPFLAWFLMPCKVWNEYGKILFCVSDVFVGYISYELLCCKIYEEMKKKSNMNLIRSKELARNWILLIWLANPFTAIISARGNADTVICASVLYTLFLLETNKIILAAIVHAALAIHLKLYPVIYLPSIIIHLSKLSLPCSLMEFCRRTLKNKPGFIYISVCMSCLIVLTFFCYSVYGERYLQEAIFYHVSRTDTRHNFSPYFYLLYLVRQELFYSRLIGILAFIPQILLILLFAFRYCNDLPFCWLITTFSFVSFNKVSTSQYFLWYTCLLTVAQPYLKINPRKAILLMGSWFAGQGLWLIPAYFFEFRSSNSFPYIWLSSLIFFIINVNIIVQLMRSYSPSHLYLRKN